MKIRYVVALNRVNNEDKTSIGCRITYMKQRKQFSTGLFVNPKHWNSKKQKVLEDTEQSDCLNKQLSPIINKINQQYNSYLKVIGSILNLEKNLTTHTARKTFASTELLYNDMPIEIASKLLGHSSISVSK